MFKSDSKKDVHRQTNLSKKAVCKNLSNKPKHSNRNLLDLNEISEIYEKEYYRKNQSVVDVDP